MFRETLAFVTLAFLWGLIKAGAIAEAAERRARSWVGENPTKDEWERALLRAKKMEWALSRATSQALAGGFLLAVLVSPMVGAGTSELLYMLGCADQQFAPDPTGGKLEWVKWPICNAAGFLFGILAFLFCLLWPVAYSRQRVFEKFPP